MVDKNSEAHEDLVGRYNIENIKSVTLITALENMLIRSNIPFSNCYGQCCGGDSNIKGNFLAMSWFQSSLLNKMNCICRHFTKGS